MPTTQSSLAKTRFKYPQSVETSNEANSEEVGGSELGSNRRTRVSSWVKLYRKIVDCVLEECAEEEDWIEKKAKLFTKGGCCYGYGFSAKVSSQKTHATCFGFNGGDCA
ncbi:hypothetical protein DY000_02038226 [Brassica cretica]|uniref:Uncharacterized protein n=1 Tax=Brassica cretica TaxID=69181 RepID=A0ABQ7B7T7_BRACR|nr:hypothetical protein DY000_02038226 [Brassica cretica]